ncbi:MAG TPA: hypothetical protein VEP29_08675, partial [Desulfatiglandales bacterium]|nr:hypothetical protein [Desulfatiglandales bacterium]
DHHEQDAPAPNEGLHGRPVHCLAFLRLFHPGLPLRIIHPTQRRLKIDNTLLYEVGDKANGFVCTMNEELQDAETGADNLGAALISLL